MPAGRPSKLTPAVLVEAEQWLKATPYEQTVADYIGVDRGTWYAWMVRGERESTGIYREFRNMVKKSKARWEITALLELRKGEEQWQRFAWLLERAIPSRWGKRVELVLKDQAERVAAEHGLDPAELIREAEKIAAGA